jgi:hypothetical protein
MSAWGVDRSTSAGPFGAYVGKEVVGTVVCPEKVKAHKLLQQARHVDNAVDCCMGSPEGRIACDRAQGCV